MKTIKGWISTGLVVTIFGLGIAQANAGIIVGDLQSPVDQGPCSVPVKVSWSIIVGNLTGIIVGNFTGIIVGNASNAGKATAGGRTDCAIIVGD